VGGGVSAGASVGNDDGKLRRHYQEYTQLMEKADDGRGYHLSDLR